MSHNDVLKFVGSTFWAAYVVKLYCSVKVSGTDDLFSERAKVKVYVLNSFVETQRYHLGILSNQQLACFMH